MKRPVPTGQPVDVRSIGTMSMMTYRRGWMDSETSESEPEPFYDAESVQNKPVSIRLPPQHGRSPACVLWEQATPEQQQWAIALEQSNGREIPRRPEPETELPAASAEPTPKPTTTRTRPTNTSMECVNAGSHVGPVLPEGSNQYMHRRRCLTCDVVWAWDTERNVQRKLAKALASRL